MRRFVDDAPDDHPPVDDVDDDGEGKAPAVWSVLVSDDCEACDDVRVVVTVEPAGEHGSGVVAHLAPAGARRLRAALGSALKELGQKVD